MDPIETVFNRAVEHHLAGRLQAAGQDYQTVLAALPDHAPSLHLLGVVAFQIGQTAAAINLMAAAIAIDDTVAAYHNDIGEVYRTAGRLDEAAAHYGHTLHLDPEHAGAMNNLGIVLQNVGRIDEAIELYRRAIAVQADFAQAHMNLGAALVEAGRADEAAHELEAAHRLAPDDLMVSLNLANARQAQGRLDEAIGIYRAVLALKPDYTEAQVNLGSALKAQGRPAAALSCYAAAIAQAPELASAHWNDGVCRLLLGDFPRGWAGFAWRWRAGAVPPHGLPGPEWDGSALDGQTLLVHAEQGLGDTIQFARFLKHLKARGAGEVILLCQAPLTRLLAGRDGVSRVVGPEEPLPAWDLRVPLLDLPRLFGTTLQTLDGATPYLTVDPARVERWRDRLGGRIGLVWQGRRDHQNDRNRSLPAALLAPLLAVPGCRFVSLQQHADPGDVAGMEDLGDAFGDLQDAAEAIAALDLVITVDTAIAHLAGALGKPVWILLPLAPDWRWLLDRTDSPWYPTARLFRQPKAGDWPAVIAAVADALSASASAY
jgi:tetratricopeptide (TPR) repeat protein